MSIPYYALKSYSHPRRNGLLKFACELEQPITKGGRRWVKLWGAFSKAKRTIVASKIEEA